MKRSLKGKQLACPACAGIDLATMEVATCIAECNGIYETGPNYAGYTDYERGEQKTVGVWCDDCDWHYQGEDWLAKLVPAAADEATP